DTSADLTGDGDLGDTILQAFDTASGAVTPFCPADTVSVAAGTAAFLRPEGAGTTPRLSRCPTGTPVAGGVDLNGDGDATDAFVHLASGGTVQNLGRAAVSVALSASCTAGTSAGHACNADTDCPGGACSASWLAALVSEAGEGGPGRPAPDLNGGGGAADTVVPVAPGAAASGGR